MLGELKKFKEEHGHTRVPQKYPPNPKLGTWVTTQRKNYKHFVQKGKGPMTQELIDVLNGLGFEWSASTGVKRDDQAWYLLLEELKTFKEEHGHTRVPQKYPHSPKLGTWVMSQRQHYKRFTQQGKGPMTQEQIDVLEGIGFQWSARSGVKHNDQAWHMMLDELTKFKKEHGHTRVPQKYPPSPKLGRWVMIQRRHHKLFLQQDKGPMTQERVEALDEIGFEWSAQPGPRRGGESKSACIHI